MTEQQATADPELTQLREEHGARYYISRVGGLWMATLRVDDDTERTIITDSPEQLADRMEHPLPGIGLMAPMPRKEL